MAFDSEGLLDFGTGAMSGGSAAAKMSGGNPYVTAAGALGMGALSFFGGGSQRRMERRLNNQQLELGELEIATIKRNQRLEEERRRRKELFGQLFSAYITGGGK